MFKKLQLLASGAAHGIDLAIASGSDAAPSQPVNVTNTPLPVRVTSLPLAVTIVPGKSVNAFNQVSDVSNQISNHVFTIPAGTRLLIEYVSAKGTVPYGDSVFAIHINNPVVFFVVVAQGTDFSVRACSPPPSPCGLRSVPSPCRRMSSSAWNGRCSGRGPSLSLP